MKQWLASLSHLLFWKFFTMSTTLNISDSLMHSFFHTWFLTVYQWVSVRLEILLIHLRTTQPHIHSFIQWALPQNLLKTFCVKNMREHQGYTLELRLMQFWNRYGRQAIKFGLPIFDLYSTCRCMYQAQRQDQHKPQTTFIDTFKKSYSIQKKKTLSYSTVKLLATVLPLTQLFRIKVHNDILIFLQKPNLKLISDR